MIQKIKKHREKARPPAAARPSSGFWAAQVHLQGHRSQVCNLASKLLHFSAFPRGPRGALGLRQPTAPQGGGGEPSHADFLYHALGDMDFIPLHSDGRRLTTYVLVVLPVLQEAHAPCHQELPPQIRDA